INSNIRDELFYRKVAKKRLDDAVKMNERENASGNYSKYAEESIYDYRNDVTKKKQTIKRLIYSKRKIQNQTLEESPTYANAKSNVKNLHKDVRKTKLPTDIITYSGLDKLSSDTVEQALSNKKKAGQVFILKRFLSSSTSKETAAGFADESRGGKVLLRI
ncbi:MAG: hypothetical protein AABY22_24530, partial [Nanoarchaeota archaeon]